MDRNAGRRALALLLVVDLALQVAGLARGWDANPFASTLRADAQVLWEHGGRVAGGELVDATPFLTAPLYVWFLGLLRALGAGLPAVLAVQLLLRAATALLVARAATRLAGGPRAGLLAAAAFLLLAGPAFHAVRVLNPALQLLLVAALMERAGALARLPSPAAAAGFGALLGLNLLAGPPMLLAVPVFAAWMWLRAPERRTGALRAGLALAACALTVAPATVHNALATARHLPGRAEFLPLSAQAGVTFAHGNAAGADGSYQPLAGVPGSRALQNEAAYALAAAEGAGPGWRATSSHFLGVGLRWMAAHPGDALALEGRKLLWLLAGSGYGDVYHYGLESSDPDWPRPLVFPAGLLQLGWLLPLAALGLLVLVRRARVEALPWLALAAVPALVVLVFWYSPRYRLPLAPVAAVLAVHGLRAAAARLSSAPPVRARVALLALMVLPPAAAEGAAALAGIDDPAPHRGPFEQAVAVEYMQQRRYADAVPRLQAAVDAGFGTARVHEALAECLVQRGNLALEAGRDAEAEADYRAALPHYAAAVRLDPGALDAVESACNVLAFLGDGAGARALASAALDEAVRRGDRSAEARLRALLRNLPR